MSGECERCGMHCLDCQCNRSGSSLVNGLELEDIVRSHYADNGWKGKRVRVESVSMLAELARLRRMADAYAAESFQEMVTDVRCIYSGGTQVITKWWCSECGRNYERPPHTATCDAAIHLDLPREGA